MEVTKTTTEATLSAVHESLVQLSVALGWMAARQEHMLLVSKKMTAALAPMATTTSLFMPGRVPEQQATKRSSPSIISAHMPVAAAAMNVGMVLASSVPTSCSTIGSAVNVGGNHAIVASGTTHIHATTSIRAGNNTLQGVVGFGVNMSAGCSTHVLSCPPDDPRTRALEIDTDIPDGGSVWDEGIPDEVLTHVGGLSLFKELYLDTHKEFEESIVKAEEAPDLIWVTPSLWNMVFGVTPPCGQSALAHGKPGLGGAHGLFDKVPPWEHNAFHPGNLATRGDHISLNKIPSWQRSAFSPGNSEIGSVNYVFVQPPRGNRLVLDQIPPWGRSDFSPGKEGKVRVHPVFKKLPSWSCDGFYPWRTNTVRNGNRAWSMHCAAGQRIKSAELRHLNILEQLACCCACPPDRYIQEVAVSNLGTNIHDHTYELYSNQWSKLQVQLPWDPRGSWFACLVLNCKKNC